MNRRYYTLKFAERQKYTIDPQREHDPDTEIPTHQVPGVLRSMGIEASIDVLLKLPRDTKGEFPTSPQGRKPKWNPELIDTAARILENKGRLTPLAGFLMEQGLTMRDYYTALFAAHRRACEEFGEGLACGILSTRPDPDHFRMILSPPLGDRKAEISFDLQPEIRQDLAAKSK